jgi:hypothetical protein
LKRIVIALFLALPVMKAGQSAPSTDPFKPLSFLEQNWDANTNGNGGVKSVGTYTFRRELAGHILARRSTGDVACKGPADFDCGDSDMLYVYEDAPGQALKAIYFDNEGHVIHYNVSTPAAGKVEFLSEASQGPQFRLTYELIGPLMTGKFQMRMPGQTEWKSYLEWSGTKH